ncbi:MAG TPA: DnaD domain protein [Clostridiaceae bacterium]|nr:DnaD domain protein [Clostridiaceae bacterium]
MEISGQEKFLLSDTVVPDIFIHEYMPRLKHAAVKCYLLVLSAFQNGKREIAKKDLALRLSFTPKDINLALQELMEEGLILLETDGIKLTDLKAIEIRTLIDSKPTTPSLRLSPEVISEREQVITAINNEYFQGLMTHAWFDMIDDWFLKHKFEPAVVQALFAEATASDKWGRLNRPFLNAIADRWAKHNVRTFSELSAFYEQNERFLEIYRHVCKVLRISYTEPGIRMVESWVDELGYDRDVIDLALEETTGSSNPSLKYVDSILRRWNSEGIRTKEQVKKDRSAWERKQKVTRRSTSVKSANRDNYEEISSSADYNEAFGLRYPKLHSVPGTLTADDSSSKEA